MTAEPHTAATDDAASAPDGSGSTGGGPDLSRAFGRPATSSLRGLLPPRPRRGDEQDGPADPAGGPDVPAPRDPDPEPADPEDAQDIGDDPGDGSDSGPAGGPGRDDPGRARAPRPAPGGRDPGARSAAPRGGGGTANHRWGAVRMASREHAELLVLAALTRGPADGRELAERLRTDSGGGLVPPPTTVQRTIHHLVRHGLVERAPDTERRRFRLTELGRRIARARVRSWYALRRAVDGVVRAADVD